MRRIENKVWRLGLALIGLVCGLFFGEVSAQNGYPFFRNFSADEYHAHNRNFDIACDSLGVIYVANFEGLIYFNGVGWQKLLTPGISRITHLLLDHEGSVWVGGHNYIGKIVAGSNDVPSLRSFISDIDDGKRLGDIVGIEEERDTLRFYTRDLRVSIREDSILGIEPYETKDFPLATTSVHPLSAIHVETDGGEGIKITDDRLGVSIRLTEAEGLCSNRVNKLVYDQRGSIWGATDNGVFQLNLPSFFSYYDAHSGLQGEIQVIYRHREAFYVGTTQGLFFYDQETDCFRAISPEIRQSCWKLMENARNELFAVTSNGLFRVEGNNVKRMNGFNTFSLAFDPSDTKRYFTGEIDGIYRYEAGKRTRISNVEKVMNLLFAQGDLWAETLYGEVYRIKDGSAILQDTSSGLGQIEGNKLILWKDSVYVLSPAGICRWQSERGKFLYPDNELNRFIRDNGEWWPGFATVFRKGHRILFVGGNARKVLATKDFLIDWAMNSKFRLLDNLPIRSAYWDRDSVIWLGNDTRLIKVNLMNQDAVFMRHPKVHIRSIRIGADSVYWGGYNGAFDQSVAARSVPVFSSRMRNFLFEYSTEHVNAIRPTRYSFCLEGPVSSGWSDWVADTRQDFNNLSYGNYTFRVKTMDGFGRESEESTFSFIIEKPYYLRWYSFLFYALVLGVLVSLYAKWRNRKLLVEKTRLETLVEQRTEQIRSQRDEIVEKSRKLEVALTDLKEAQDQLIQQEKIATVGKLTQGLIDRILNPLNYIINFSRLSTVLLKDMDEDLEDEKEHVSEDNYEDMREILGMLRTHLEKIEDHGNSTSRILKAMEEMLSDHSCHFVRTDLNKLIKSNLELLKEYYQKEILETGIEISFDEPDFMVEADVDPLQLGKVLMSMMQNSLYALEKKRANGIAYDALMRITLTVADKNVRIILWDNGIGIENAILGKIFDPFFTTKTTSEAAGVGLYLSREIVLNHNGKLEVRSEKGEYTEFILLIPIHQSIISNGNE